MKNESILCRYQVGDNGTWHLSLFNNENPQPKQEGTEPDWLKTILAVASAADAFITPKHPPPYRILWFRMDQSHNLISFGHD